MSIQADEYYILELPSGNAKICLFERGQTISLGKFGSFQVDQLLGKPLSVPYLINGDVVQPNPTNALFDDYELQVNDALNNKNISVDGSQELSLNDIEHLKEESIAGNLSGKALIERLAGSNASFKEKTDYSKAKYLKRKEEKYVVLTWD